MNKYEERIISLCERNINYIFVFFMTLVGIYARYLMLPFLSSDYAFYNLEWYNQLKECGGVWGIAEYQGNYNYAYIFLLSLLTYIPIPGILSIKFLHIVFDFVGAVTAGLLAKRVYSDNDFFREGWSIFSLTYVLVFLSPLVMLNSAYWGQCDFIYTSFVLLAIYMLLAERHALCFLLYGVALSFKLQAIFIFPLFVLVYILNRKFSITRFLFMPVGFLASSLPGMLFSKKGIRGLLNIYFGQVQQEEVLALNYPNIYYWISESQYDLYLRLGIFLLIFIFGCVAFYLVKKQAHLTNDQIIALGMWCVLCVVYFCPKMHERYGFAAEVLSIIWVMGHKKWIWYPIITSLTVLFSYFAVLYGYYLYNYQDMALVNVVTFIVFTIYIFSDIVVQKM